jgi:hypothetical protein
MGSLPLFRYAFQERLRAVFAPPARVLEVGKQPGEDAHLLRGSGVGVEVRAPEDLGGLAPAFDGAYCSVGALEGADLGRAGRDLAAALRPGAPVLLGLANPRSSAPVRLSPREVRERLGPAFRWRGSFAWGLLLPRDAAWIPEHPQAFGLLAALERIVRRWPGLRGRGEIVVLEGTRR